MHCLTFFVNLFRFIWLSQKLESTANNVIVNFNHQVIK